MRSIIVYLAVFIIAIGGMFAFGSDDKAATRLLTKNGYTDIRIKGYEFFGCGKDEFFHTAFVAKNQYGVEIEGIVCKGILKDSTIRFKD